ncbi:MAG: dipeptidase PepE [Propioniciclava sp.]|uniref:dipeptidase PepE n=1 Tax=Propioniciclava sp. TaxID=2038686 RepID=UPI0039E33847
MRLMLLSNSTAPGRGYLEHAAEPLGDLLTGVRELAFVPFALADHEGYTATVAAALARFGVRVAGAHTGEPAQVVGQADAVFVGGGNTFRLVSALYRTGLIEAVPALVREGMPYLGSSAGTNVATPSLRTTNDMPIVEVPSFATFGLVPFQINPHYLDPDPTSTHQGETRDERLRQYLEENDVPVLAMREGTWLRRDGDSLSFEGADAGGRLYRQGTDTVEIPAPTDVSYLLNG